MSVRKADNKVGTSKISVLPSFSVIIPFHNNSGLTIRAISSLVKTQGPLVGHGLAVKKQGRNVSELNLSELSGPRRVFWIDTRLDDVIWASKKMIATVARSFPQHRIREI